MRSFSSSTIVRFLLAPLLILWVSGAGCMLGCEGMVVAAAGSDQQAGTALRSANGVTIVASGHACSSSSGASSAGELNKSHSCCKKSSTKTQANASRAGLSTGAATLVQYGEPSSGMMKDCPLAGTKTAVVTKSRSGSTEASPAVAHSCFSAQSFLEQAAPPSTSRRLPNRGHTYLRCCVFLI